MSLEDLRTAGAVGISRYESAVAKQNAPRDDGWLLAAASTLAALDLQLAGCWQWDTFAEECDVALPIACAVASGDRQLDAESRSEVVSAWNWMCNDFRIDVDRPVEEVLVAVAKDVHSA